MNEPTLEEAVECMIEGAAATKPCRGNGFLTNEGKRPTKGSQLMNFEIAYACADGAIVYGALLRGHSEARAIDLSMMFGSKFAKHYGQDHVYLNDNLETDDYRDEIIRMAKDML